MRRFSISIVIALCFAGATFAQTPTLIQHVSGSDTLQPGHISAGGSYNLPLPNATLQGNALICSFTYDNTQAPAVSVTDNKGNAWSLGAAVSDPAHTTASAIYYALNVAAGTNVVRLNFLSNSANFIAVMVSEFNNVATVSAKDGSTGNFGTSGTVTAGSLTPTAAGDLIYQYAARDSSGSNKWNQGSSPWILLSADQIDGMAAQYQVQPAAGTINPTLTTASSKAFSSVAIALKAAAAGTPLPSGIRVLKLQHNNTQNETDPTVTLQFPTKDGNLLVLAYSSGSYDLSRVTDSNGNNWIHTGGLQVIPDTMEIFHVANPATSAGLSLTCTMAGNDPNGNGASLFLYEIVGASTSPLDTAFGINGASVKNGNQNQITSSGPVPTFTATPGGPNELIIVVGSMAADTATGWSGPAGAQQIATTYSGELNPTNGDENNPAGLFYNGSNVSSQTWTIVHDTLNNPGIGTWAVGGAAFKPGAGGPTTNTPPTNPTSLAATAISSSQISLSWTASTDDVGVTGYFVDLCQGAGCTSFSRVATLAGTVTSFSDTGLLAATSYSYRVSATDGAGLTSGFSNVATATTQSSAVTFTPPSALSATVSSSSQINLSWTAATETGGTLTNYLVERCQAAGCTAFAQVGTATATAFSNTGLTASTSYSYRVRATDAAGNFSGFSNVATAITRSSPVVFTAPSNLTAAVASSTQINLSWTAATETGGTLSNYLIERCQAAGCTDFAQVGASTTTAFTSAGLTVSTSYNYRVRATDAAGNFSAYSNTASATSADQADAQPPVAISFIQANSATPQTPQSTVTVRYLSAQRVGDLNVVVVGWNDSTATVASVTDTIGNLYALAIGPTVQAGIATQSIYYAKNIPATTAGANTVSVRFNGSARYPDIRIAEYSGIDPTNPVDVTAASSGNGGTASSGTATTTHANDLIIGANLVQTGTPGAGTGFTKRIITSPDSDILQDRVVAVDGSYSASSPVSAPAAWIMQMVAFKAHP